MKRIIIALLALFLMALLFFTVSGEWLYERMTPELEVERLGRGITWQQEGYLAVPEHCVSDGCVWIVTEERGFSMTLYTLYNRAVTCAELPEQSGVQPGYVYIPQKELRYIPYLATDGNGNYHNGQRIKPAK